MRTLLTQKFCLMCNTQVLYLNGNQIGDTSMISLAEALGKGALASLETLSLQLNRIGNDGLTAFAKAIKPTSDNASGALPQLKKLQLYTNQIGDVGMQALAGAVSKGALPKCTYIDLIGNPASDEAKQAVRDTIAKRQ